jgi:hypothetical protein
MSLYASTSPPAALSGSEFMIGGWFKVVNTAGSTDPILTITLSSSHVAKLYYRPSPIGYAWELDNGTNSFTKDIGHGYTGWNFWSFAWHATSYRHSYNNNAMSSGVASATLASGLSLVSLEYDSAVVAIDELGVWDAWLTWSSDFTTLYNSGSGITHSGASIFNDCISYWKLDEATGATRADSVGSWDLADTAGDVSAYTGILSNGALADGSGGSGDAVGAAFAGFHGFAK